MCTSTNSKRKKCIPGCLKFRMSSRRKRAGAATAMPGVRLVALGARVTVSDVNEALKQASEESLAGYLGYSDKPLVSVDHNGSSLSSIVDAPTTYVIEDMVKVLSWYDNETGYSHRMVDLAEMVGKEL